MYNRHALSCFTTANSSPYRTHMSQTSEWKNHSLSVYPQQSLVPVPIADTKQQNITFNLFRALVQTKWNTKKNNFRNIRNNIQLEASHLSIIECKFFFFLNWKNFPHRTKVSELLAGHLCCAELVRTLRNKYFSRYPPKYQIHADHFFIVELLIKHITNISTDFRVSNYEWWEKEDPKTK